MGYEALDIANLSRSLNEALVLAELLDGAKHGYQLALEVAEASDGEIRFKHGTLYPILHRLEQSGMISGSWSDEGPRGKRRSYVLTQEGRRHLAVLRREWTRLANLLASSLGEAP